jgi:hypothetical protein
VVVVKQKQCERTRVIISGRGQRSADDAAKPTVVRERTMWNVEASGLDLLKVAGSEPAVSVEVHRVEERRQDQRSDVSNPL